MGAFLAFLLRRLAFAVAGGLWSLLLVAGSMRLGDPAGGLPAVLVSAAACCWLAFASEDRAEAVRGDRPWFRQSWQVLDLLSLTGLSRGLGFAMAAVSGLAVALALGAAGVDALQAMLAGVGGFAHGLAGVGTPLDGDGG